MDGELPFGDQPLNVDDGSRRWLLKLRAAWIEAVSLDQRLSAGVVRYALVLAMVYLNKDPGNPRRGCCWPGPAAMMEHLGCGITLVREARAQLRQYGYLELAEAGGAVNPAVYRMLLPVRPGAPVRPDAPVRYGGSTRASRRTAPVRPGGPNLEGTTLKERTRGSETNVSGAAVASPSPFDDIVRSLTLDPFTDELLRERFDFGHVLAAESAGAITYRDDGSGKWLWFAEAPVSS